MPASSSTGAAPAIHAMLAALAPSPDPVFVTNRHNRLVFWNASAQRMLGFDENEVLGTSCAALLHGCDRFGNRYCDDCCPILQMATRGELIRQFGLALYAKDGQTIVADVSVLTLSVPPPEGFYLAHILRPAGRADSTAAHQDAPPCSLLEATRMSADARARRLTVREVEVLGMLAAGRTTPEIAERLFISTITARNHIQNVLDKLEVHSKAEAVAFAFQKRLL